MTAREKMARATQPTREVRRSLAVNRIARATFAGDIDALLSIEDVAEILGLPISWVYDRTRRRSLDRIPGFRLGKYWRFRRAEILEWIERQRSGAVRSV